MRIWRFEPGLTAVIYEDMASIIRYLSPGAYVVLSSTRLIIKTPDFIRVAGLRGWHYDFCAVRPSWITPNQHLWEQLGAPKEKVFPLDEVFVRLACGNRKIVEKLLAVK